MKPTTILELQARIAMEIETTERSIAYAWEETKEKLAWLKREADSAIQRIEKDGACAESYMPINLGDLAHQAKQVRGQTDLLKQLRWTHDALAFLQVPAEQRVPELRNEFAGRYIRRLPYGEQAYARLYWEHLSQHVEGDTVAYQEHVVDAFAASGGRLAKRKRSVIERELRNVTRLRLYEMECLADEKARSDFNTLKQMRENQETKAEREEEKCPRNLTDGPCPCPDCN